MITKVFYVHLSINLHLGYAWNVLKSYVNVLC